MLRALTLLLTVLAVMVLIVGCMDLSGPPVATNPDTASSPTATTDSPTQATELPTTEASTTAEPNISGTTVAPDGSDEIPPPSTDRNGFPNLPQDDATKRY